jgi:hypothetical protein
MFKCECCDHTSANLSNLTKHIKNMHPEHEIKRVQCICMKMILSYALEQHLLECKGITVLQCETCKKTFSCAQSKSVHKKKNNCVFVDIPTAIVHNDNSVTTNTDNSVNSHNNTVNNINNNIVNNISLTSPDATSVVKVLDYASSKNNEMIVAHIHNNPSEIQMAHKLGKLTLHQSLTSMSHFTGPLETRNIKRMDPKNSIAKVYIDGKPQKEKITKVLDIGEARNREIANTPSIKQYLTDDPNEILLSPPTVDKIWRAERMGRRLVMENKGGYCSRVKESIPSEPHPDPVPTDTLVDLMIHAMFSSEDPNLQEVFYEIFVAACNQLCNVGGEWWMAVPTGTGWQMCKDAEYRIQNILYDLQKKTIYKVLKMVDSAESKEERIALKKLCDAICLFETKESSSQIIKDKVEGTGPSPKDT